jgi:signal transduction histidine kinase
MMPSRYPEAAFLSAVTAGVTHEMRNVLAIIKESAGLVGDMVRLCSEGRTLDPEKVRRAVDRVDAQVKRGADILSGLNRLSHAIDQDLATLDLAQELQQVVFLSQRRARIRSLTVQVTDSTVGGEVRVHPLHLQMALFSVLDHCIEAFPEGSRILAGVKAESGRVSVEFRGENDSGVSTVLLPEGVAWKETEAQVSAVGGELRIFDRGSGVEIRFGVT